jgi:hypothetical protein
MFGDPDRVVNVLGIRRQGQARPFVPGCEVQGPNQEFTVTGNDDTNPFKWSTKSTEALGNIRYHAGLPSVGFSTVTRGYDRGNSALRSLILDDSGSLNLVKFVWTSANSGVNFIEWTSAAGSYDTWNVLTDKFARYEFAGNYGNVPADAQFYVHDSLTGLVDDPSREANYVIYKGKFCPMGVCSGTVQLRDGTLNLSQPTIVPRKLTISSLRPSAAFPFQIDAKVSLSDGSRTANLSLLPDSTINTPDKFWQLEYKSPYMTGESLVFTFVVAEGVGMWSVSAANNGLYQGLGFLEKV